MQTFICESDLGLSMSRLDFRRLGKQRVEAKQILIALRDSTYGWQNHPAVRMWRPYGQMLRGYYNLALREWIRRGYQNHMAEEAEAEYTTPAWVTPEFIRAHRSNLLRKDPKWYGGFGWGDIPHDLAYVWPQAGGATRSEACEANPTSDSRDGAYWDKLAANFGEWP